MARENMFGRRLFEAFASEFAVTHLNENKEIRKLQAIVAEKNQKLQEATQVVKKASVIVESKEKEIRIIKESAERKETMSKLLKTLNTEKAAIMGELLESVQTPKLQSAFDKYLPAVLNNSAVKSATQKVALTESVKEVTGDKSAKKNAVVQQADTNVVELKRLAGLK
jgi:Skp family chaperone for outer membrane proteins